MAITAAGIQTPVLWISLPTAVDVVGALSERAVVYYCCDDFSALEGVDHRAVCEMEEELVERADLVLAASAVLKQRFPANKTWLLPHGVDVELFSTPATRAPDLPTDLPVAGFYGSLAGWVDWELLASVAARMSHWRFVLIGQRRTDLSSLRRLANVYVIGPRPHAALPSYSQHWTVSLLPFRNTAQIRASSPLKLREYLAAGRPVVSTDFPGLDGYRDLVTVARDPGEFATALEAARAEPLGLRDLRRARVAGESWAARAREAENLIDSLM